MVFCYKIITDTPRRRRSGLSSPRKGSPNRLPSIETSLSQLVNSWDYESESTSDLLDAIPEREWRLLATLARKREDDAERDKLAEQFRRMWEKEKIERQMVEEELSEQYKRYLRQKRKQEEYINSLNNLKRNVDQQNRRGQLLDFIKYKEILSANRIADVNDKKNCEILGKALEGHARCLLANDKRLRLEAAQELRKEVDLLHDISRVDDARKKRRAMLRDVQQRTAICNALSTWESALVREEVNSLEAARRAHFAAHAALTDLRSAKLARAREMKQRRARKMAVLTQQLRDVVRNGWL